MKKKYDLKNKVAYEKKKMRNLIREDDRWMKKLINHCSEQVVK